MKLIVSILVLVDFALKRNAGFALIERTDGFQSLFWWILLLNLRIKFLNIVIQIRFQSLFWWILLLNSVFFIA